MRTAVETCWTAPGWYGRGATGGDPARGRVGAAGVARLMLVLALFWWGVGVRGACVSSPAPLTPAVRIAWLAVSGAEFAEVSTAGLRRV